MKRSYPDSFIVPCFDIDLIWHTHLLNPLSYKSDTMLILGEHFGHDDSVNDRTDGSKLCLSMHETQIMWEELYKERFTNIASMYRGLPPNGKLKNNSKDFAFQTLKQIAFIDILSIQVVRKAVSSKRKKICGIELTLDCYNYSDKISKANKERKLDKQDP